MKYYSGVYQDDNGKVFQVSDDIDGISCEVLAYPGCHISSDFPTVAEMIKTAKITAHFLMCHHLEINCDKGQGSYRYIRIQLHKGG